MFKILHLPPETDKEGNQIAPPQEILINLYEISSIAPYHDGNPDITDFQTRLRMKNSDNWYLNEMYKEFIKEIKKDLTIIS